MAEAFKSFGSLERGSLFRFDGTILKKVTGIPFVFNAITPGSVRIYRHMLLDDGQLVELYTAEPNVIRLPSRALVTR